ncbi:hypothetical protein CspeluHIS016_0207140 [Cutaneotrichosporon spelunceum]|uniref:Uncharacterized protein n=1 Tax=Cutaneotrichosporon spelunceum TaxID=1672016 RepID=A0AAD3YB28_9TREE|nr:hypothetical protein CspeluHIS016_0207140 [Cutaneotrichosporon spelunceum]
MPALTPIAQPPHAISQAEHDQLTSSTPASFDDIPPVLRWEGDAEVSLSVPSWTAWGAAPEANGVGGDGGDSCDSGGGGNDGGHGVSHRVPGRLYVTEQSVAFIPHQQQGFALTFPNLTLHALTPSGMQPAHIYCQIDEGDATDEDEYSALAEMRIFVANEQLTSLFDALSACSALHASRLPSGEPSSFFGFADDDDDDDEWEDDQFNDADEPAGGRLVTDENGATTNAKLKAGDVPAAAGTDDDDDPVAQFLSKVDWTGVQTDGSWVDVPDTALRSQLDAANQRIVELEAKLREVGLEP